MLIQKYLLILAVLPLGACLETKSKGDFVSKSYHSVTDDFRVTAAANLGSDFATVAWIALDSSPVEHGPLAPEMAHYRVLANNCVYSKTQAPDKPIVWYKLLNPHPVGIAQSPSYCPNRLSN